MMMRGGWHGGGGRGGYMAAWLEKPQRKSSAWQILRRLGGVLGEQKRHMVWALLTVIAASGLNMVPPWATRYIIDQVIPHARYDLVWGLGLGLAAVQAARYGLQYANRYYLAVASQQLVFQMAKRLFEHVQRLSLRFYERQGTGEIISRATNDVGVLQQSLTGGVVSAAARLLDMGGYGIIMF